MKKILIITCILFSTFNSFALETSYVQYIPTYKNSYYRPTYNPYSDNLYYGLNRYRKTNYNNAKRLQKINRIRNLNKIKNNIINRSVNNLYNGSLTGYSVPINKNIYNQINSNLLENYNKTTPYCNTNLFTFPSSNNLYYRNGQYLNQNGGASSKTGVQIIYD